jgi:hypothetical protein
MYSEKSLLGELLYDPAAKEVLMRHLPELFEQPYLLANMKIRTLQELLHFEKYDEAKADALVKELASVVPQIRDDEPDFANMEAYDLGEATRGTAPVEAAPYASRWGVYEVTLNGPTGGNPFVQVKLSAEFACGDLVLAQRGFYDGDGRYRIRFMPPAEGDWTFRTSSNIPSMDGITGSFRCGPAKDGDRGPVRVCRTFHFAYEDGTPYLPFGTTCYAWIHQPEDLQEQTLATLRQSPFNKLRMCVFPKAYLYNLEEPDIYPYEGSRETGWDYYRFNVAFFQRLEKRIAQLKQLGIEADLILFHPYDTWGFSEMPRRADELYLTYITARLSAYSNVWWSLANEYDLMWAKKEEDWERFAALITEHDPYRHLISIHNCIRIYDFSKPWVTHCCIQRTDAYKTTETTPEWRQRWGKPVVVDECAYEGNIDQDWGDITGEEMTRRFWEGAIRGGYVGHGETYVNPEEILWWSKGGRLTGSSPARIRFLRQIMEETPGGYLEPLPPPWGFPVAGIEDEYYITYFGFFQPSFKTFKYRPGLRFEAEVIDTWNMTIEKLPGVYEGSFRIELPGRPYMAIRLKRVP